MISFDSENVRNSYLILISSKDESYFLARTFLDIAQAFLKYFLDISYTS